MKNEGNTPSYNKWLRSVRYPLVFAAAGLLLANCVDASERPTLSKKDSTSTRSAAEAKISSSVLYQLGCYPNEVPVEPTAHTFGVEDASRVHFNIAQPNSDNLHNQRGLSVIYDPDTKKLAIYKTTVDEDGFTNGQLMPNGSLQVFELDAQGREYINPTPSGTIYLNIQRYEDMIQTEAHCTI